LSVNCLMMSLCSSSTSKVTTSVLLNFARNSGILYLKYNSISVYHPVNSLSKTLRFKMCCHVRSTSQIGLHCSQIDNAKSIFIVIFWNHDQSFVIQR
jgi:peptide deformylase